MAFYSTFNCTYFNLLISQISLFYLHSSKLLVKKKYFTYSIFDVNLMNKTFRYKIFSLFIKLKFQEKYKYMILYINIHIFLR